MKTTRVVSLLAIAAIAGLPDLAFGQLPTGGRRTKTAADVASQVPTEALQPDFSGTWAVVPQGIIESYSETNPCQPHSHTYTGTISIRRRMGTFPNPTATLYRDGQPIESWTITVPAGTAPVVLGTFTWTKNHPCPGGSTSIGPEIVPNYRLVVDPGNQVNEHSESNNVVQFYVDPSAGFVKKL